MKIASISNSKYNFNASASNIKANCAVDNKKNNCMQTPKLLTNSYYVPVNFKNRGLDVQLIDEMKNSVESIVTNACTHILVNYNDENGFNYGQAIRDLTEHNPNLTKKLVENPKLFKKLESDYSYFFNTTIASIDEVADPNSKKCFHELSSLNNSTINTIKRAYSLKTIDEVNNFIKKADENTILDIKKILSRNWFDNKVSDFTNDKPIFENSHLVQNIKNRYIDEFDNCTTNLYFCSASDNKRKSLAFRNASVQILKSLNKNPNKADYLLNIIKEMESELQTAYEKKDLNMLNDKIEEYFNVARTEFIENDLNDNVKTRLEKHKYLKDKEKNYLKVKSDSIYQNLDVNSRYVIIRYLENFDKFDKISQNKNPLYFMLQDIHYQENDLIHKIIPKVVSNISIKENNVMQNLDMMHSLINSDFEKLKDTDFSAFSPFDKYNYSAELYGDYIQKYIDVLCDPKSISIKQKDKINLLKQLPIEEFNQITDLVKQDWQKNELAQVIRNEFRIQAYQNDIQTKSFEELKQINKNLQNIKITIDNISCSVSDLVSNIKQLPEMYDTTLKQKELGEKTQKTLTQIEKNYNNAPIETKQIYDKKIKEQLPIVLNKLKTNCNTGTDKKTIEALTFIEAKIKNSSAPTSEFVKQAQRMFSYEANYLIRSKFSHAAMPKIKPALPAVDTSNIANEITNQAQIFENSTGGSSILSSLVDPLTIVAIATAVFACYSITEMNKLEQNMRPLYFSL